MNHVGTKTIEAKRLTLRRFEYSDIDSMLRNWISDEKTQWDYGEPCYDTNEKVKELFDTKYVVSYSSDDYYRWAVIEKCGLTYEGTLRDYFNRKDHYESKMYFSILRSEYDANDNK